MSLVTQFLATFGTAERRVEAVRRLAAWIGAECVVILTRDVEAGSLVPIMPFSHAAMEAVEWRGAVASAGAEGSASAVLPHPATGAPVPVLLQRSEDGSVLAAVGGRPRPARLQWAMRMVPLLAKIVRGEQAEMLAAHSRDADARAADASRLKDDFLATLSHELRTPLNAMIGWIQMLRLYRHDEGLRERALDVIERNARTQTQIVLDLLDVSRIITGKLRLRVSRVDLADVVAAACESLRPSIEARDLTVTVTAAPGAVVYGDADRLQQIVWNLLSNAAKFTAPGGRIEVRLGMRESSAWIRVTDTGVGIHPEFVPFVFERFRQWDSTMTRAHGGLGLGLAIVRHLVELHGGTVEAASEGTGRGATFTVRLPRRPAESPAQVPMERAKSDVT